MSVKNKLAILSKSVYPVVMESTRIYVLYIYMNVETSYSIYWDPENDKRAKFRILELNHKAF